MSENVLICIIADKAKNILKWVFGKLGIKNAGAAAETTAQAITFNDRVNLVKLLSRIGAVVYIGKYLLLKTDLKSKDLN